MSVNASDNKFQLRVSLFPWIPAEESFANWIEDEFEKQNSDIDLVIRPMQLARDSYIDLSYNIGDAVNALTEDERPDYQHIVEIDTIILSALVSAGAVQPFSIDRDDYFKFATDAVNVNGVTYGVPHWTCGYFVMSPHDSVVASGDAVELRNALERLGTPFPDLGGPIEGSWSSVIVYLDAFLDTLPEANPSIALDDIAPNRHVEPFISAFGDACSHGEDTLCDLEEGGNEAEKMFSRGQLDALVGYSESLHAVFSEDGGILEPDDIKIAPAPIGGGKSAFYFTDALVLSPKCNTDQCKDAATRFARFYISDDVFAASMMGIDQVAQHGEQPIPRYLLPSTSGAYGAGQVQLDPIYGQLLRTMDSALPYPNAGIPQARSSGAIRKFVKEKIHTAKGR